MIRQMTLLTTVCCLLFLYSCSKDGSNNNNNNNSGGLDCSTVTNKAFAADVNPIIQGTCASQTACHGSGSVNGPGALTTYSAIFNSRNNIRSAIASGTMPKTGTLSTAQKNSILCWIDGGAPNN